MTERRQFSVRHPTDDSTLKPKPIKKYDISPPTSPILPTGTTQFQPTGAVFKPRSSEMLNDSQRKSGETVSSLLQKNQSNGPKQIRTLQQVHMRPSENHRGGLIRTTETEQFNQIGSSQHYFSKISSPVRTKGAQKMMPQGFNKDARQMNAATTGSDSASPALKPLQSNTIIMPAINVPNLSNSTSAPILLQQQQQQQQPNVHHHHHHPHPHQQQPQQSQRQQHQQQVNSVYPSGLRNIAPATQTSSCTNDTSKQAQHYVLVSQAPGTIATDNKSATNLLQPVLINSNIGNLLQIKQTVTESATVGVGGANAATVHLVGKSAFGRENLITYIILSDSNYTRDNTCFVSVSPTRSISSSVHFTAFSWRY